MPDTTISQLPAAASANLNAVVAADNAAGTATEKVTLGAIASLATKSSVGLGNADNTSDADKPISTATQTALDGKLAISSTILSGSLTLRVDGARTDSYTADGTVLRPFKTIQAAHDYAAANIATTAATPNNVIISISAGNYVENLTVTRPNTHYVGMGQRTKAVRISGTVTINISTNPSGMRDSNLVAFDNLLVITLTGSDSVMTAGGSASYLLYLNNTHLSTGSVNAKCFAVTNTSAAGIKVEARNVVVGNDASSAVAMDFGNTSWADLDQLSVETGSGPAIDFRTTYALVFNSRFQSLDNAGAVIKATSPFAAGQPTLSMYNCGISNLNANGSGIEIASGAIVNIGHVTFSVGTAAGTGFAVDGVAGAVLVSAASLVNPGTNAKVATAITSTSLGTSLTRSGVVLDTRTPASHTHGSITNAGAIGSTANLPVITTTSGVLTTGSFGTAANTFCQGNDSRLIDARSPLATSSSFPHGSSGAAKTLSATAALQTCSLTANCTFTMPAAAASNFTLILTNTGSFTATFTGVKWPGGVAPTITTGANKTDIIRFASDGVGWFGQIVQNY